MGSPSNFGGTNGYLPLITHLCRDHWQRSYKMHMLVALSYQPLAHGTPPFCAVCSAPAKHWKFRKSTSANNQRKMSCSGLMCSQVPIHPSQDTTSSKLRLGCPPLQGVISHCNRNLYGEEFGNWQCRARLGIFCGEPVEMLSQQNPTWCGAVCWRTHCAISVHKMQKKFYILYGLVQLFLGFGKMILNGHSVGPLVSRILRKSSSMFWIRTATQNCLLCSFGTSGTEGTLLEPPPQAGLWSR